ncbi:hypothetical protein FACS189490_02160 [Clostridia bacterium]|nr:hypothetical protein FACS189490_02160 [Clostridia bacterium]
MSDTDEESVYSVVSTNKENNDKIYADDPIDGFRYRASDNFTYKSIPLYDEITFIGLDGQELVKVTADGSPKSSYPLSSDKKNVSLRENTYVKAETYFADVSKMKRGEIYVSEVVGAYVGSNYIGMYVPSVVDKAAEDRGYDIAYDPQAQAYAGAENPDGQRFEGIVRWATPVANGNGEIIGYVTFALNHDHIMEFVDHLTPMSERYTELPDAFKGNYAFIWDYESRSICHPRHHSIIGFNPETGDREVPWLQDTIYDGWQESGTEKWFDYIEENNIPSFDNQSRANKPSPALTKAGLVGLDGRYLNNAPQCTGWMDLTKDGGSGSFYILWSGVYKLTTAAAIPYYTGMYSPTERGGSLRGFGFVAIGAGLDDFTNPANATELKLTAEAVAIRRETTVQLVIAALGLVLFVVLAAVAIASALTGSITDLVRGVSRFRSGERQFRFTSADKSEFGVLANAFDEMAESISKSDAGPLSIIDMQKRVIYMNEAGLRYIGININEAVGMPYEKVSVYPEGTKYSPIKALEEGRVAEIYHVRSQDLYLRGSASYFTDSEGNRIGYIVSSTNLTDVVKEQIKNFEQSTLLSEIFAAAPEMIWYKNITDNKYLAVNPRFASLTGKPIEEITGKTPKDIVSASLQDSDVKYDAEVIQTQKPLYTEETILFADGHTEILDCVRVPIFNRAGKLSGLLGFGRDVSARVKMEEDLRKTQTNLEQAVIDANRANAHKGEFLARMSHEIRTPMNAIMGITAIVERKLQEMQVDAEEKGEVLSSVKQIETSSYHLLGILNDILDLSKIEAGKIELADDVMDIRELTETIVTIIKPRCDQKGIKFITSFDEFEPHTFLSDPLRLRQVLINLLGNAVKFTPEVGEVEFKIEKLERNEKERTTRARFTVRDTGIGISEDAQSTIFKSFEQENADITRKFGGTGLGLAISDRIVDLFGGHIDLVSRLDEGSTFSFSILLRETEEVIAELDADLDSTGKFKGKRVLLTDDVDINRMIVVSMLEDTGIEIEEACDGAEAVKLFEQSEPGYFDIIFMDIQMPIMNGYEASKTIRALDRPDAKTVPIVAFTANAFKEDVDKAMAHGMTSHIAKPIEIERILRTLFKYVG